MPAGVSSSLSARRVGAGADPAAGAEINEVVPAGKHWQVEAVRFSLVTDATVANRRVALTIDDGTTIFWSWRCGIDQAASLTRTYQYMPGLEAEIDRSAVDGTFYAPLPKDLILMPGFRVRTATTAVQGGDNFGAPTLYIVEYG